MFNENLMISSSEVLTQMDGENGDLHISQYISLEFVLWPYKPVSQCHDTSSRLYWQIDWFAACCKCILTYPQVEDGPCYFRRIGQLPNHLKTDLIKSFFFTIHYMKQNSLKISIEVYWNFLLKLFELHFFLFSFFFGCFLVQRVLVVNGYGCL